MDTDAIVHLVQALQAAPRPTTPFLGYFMLAAAAVGGIIAIVANLALEHYRTRQRRAALRVIIKAEIKAIADLAASRNDLESLLEHRRKLSEGEPVMLPKMVDPTLPLDPVFAAVVGELGLLPENEAATLVTFYRRVRAVRFEMAALPILAQEHPIEAAARITAIEELYQSAADQARAILGESTQASPEAPAPSAA